MTASKLRDIIRKTRRAVIKIGSSVLVDEKNQFSHKTLVGIAKGIATIKKKGVRVTLVSSGAIASGMKYLGFKKRPRRISELQASAAIGQPILIRMYQQTLLRAGLQVAQVLLTWSDLMDRTRYLNAKHTLNELLERDVIPIINENDTVVVDEIRVGDNDNLAALVTNVVEADLLILLTDQDGFYTADPRKDPTATRIPIVENVDGETLAKAADTGSASSVGGMLTKLEAARKAAEFGVPTIIAGGRDTRVLERIFTAAEPVGTLFLPRVARLTARKHWIAYTLRPHGRVVVDDGARRALTEGKKSLLPSGVVAVEGKFQQGDPVHVADREGRTFARGLVAYDSEELPKILGKKTSDVEAILGYRGPDEVIHRDDMVIL